MKHQQSDAHNIPHQTRNSLSCLYKRTRNVGAINPTCTWISTGRRCEVPQLDANNKKLKRQHNIDTCDKWSQERNAQLPGTSSQYSMLAVNYHTDELLWWCSAAKYSAKVRKEEEEEELDQIIEELREKKSKSGMIVLCIRERGAPSPSSSSSGPITPTVEDRNDITSMKEI